MQRFHLFGGKARPGPAEELTASPDPLAIDFQGKEKKKGEEREKRRGEGKGGEGREGGPQYFDQVYANVEGCNGKELTAVCGSTVSLLSNPVANNFGAPGTL